MGTKQHEETYTGTITDNTEIYIEREVSGNWTPFRTLMSDVKAFLLSYFAGIFAKKVVRILGEDARLAQFNEELIEGQEYVIYFTSGSLSSPSANISEIVTKGVMIGGVIMFDRNCKCLISATGDYENCEYILTNSTQEFRCQARQKFEIRERTTTGLTLKVLYSTYKSAAYSISNVSAGGNTEGVFQIVSSLSNTWDNVGTRTTFGASTGLDDSAGFQGLIGTGLVVDTDQIRISAYDPINIAPTGFENTNYLTIEIYTDL